MYVLLIRVWYSRQTICHMWLHPAVECAIWAGNVVAHRCNITLSIHGLNKAGTIDIHKLGGQTSGLRAIKKHSMILQSGSKIFSPISKSINKSCSKMGYEYDPRYVYFCTNRPIEWLTLGNSKSPQGGFQGHVSLQATRYPWKDHRWYLHCPPTKRRNSIPYPQKCADHLIRCQWRLPRWTKRWRALYQSGRRELVGGCLSPCHPQRKPEHNGASHFPLHGYHWYGTLRKGGGWLSLQDWSTIPLISYGS